MARYAEFSPYGTRTKCDFADRLMRFETREERDEYVARLNRECGMPDGVAAPVTWLDARRRYDLSAFDAPWATATPHKSGGADWSRSPWPLTCRGSIVWEIGTR